MPAHALATAQEFIRLNKLKEALNALHDVLQVRRLRAFQPVHKDIMILYFDLCFRVDVNPKDGLYFFRSIAQDNPEEMEEILLSYLTQSQEPHVPARKIYESVRNTLLTCAKTQGKPLYNAVRKAVDVGLQYCLDQKQASDLSAIGRLIRQNFPIDETNAGIMTEIRTKLLDVSSKLSAWNEIYRCVSDLRELKAYHSDIAFERTYFEKLAEIFFASKQLLLHTYALLNVRRISKPSNELNRIVDLSALVAPRIKLSEDSSIQNLIEGVDITELPNTDFIQNLKEVFSTSTPQNLTQNVAAFVEKNFTDTEKEYVPHLNEVVVKTLLKLFQTRYSKMEETFFVSLCPPANQLVESSVGKVVMKLVRDGIINVQYDKRHGLMCFPFDSQISPLRDQFYVFGQRILALQQRMRNKTQYEKNLSEKKSLFDRLRDEKKEYPELYKMRKDTIDAMMKNERKYVLQLVEKKKQEQKQAELLRKQEEEKRLQEEKLRIYQQQQRKIEEQKAAERVSKKQKEYFEKFDGLAKELRKIPPQLEKLLSLCQKSPFSINVSDLDSAYVQYQMYHVQQKQRERMLVLRRLDYLCRAEREVEAEEWEQAYDKHCADAKNQFESTYEVRKKEFEEEQKKRQDYLALFDGLRATRSGFHNAVVKKLAEKPKPVKKIVKKEKPVVKKPVKKEEPVVKKPVKEQPVVKKPEEKDPSRGGFQPRGGNSGYQPRGGSSGYQPRGGSSGYQPRGGSSGYQPRGGSSGYQPRGGNSAYQPRGGSGSQPRGGAYQPRGGSGSQPRGGAYRPRGGSSGYRPRGGSGNQPRGGGAYRPKRGDGEGDKPKGDKPKYQPRGGAYRPRGGKS